MSDDKQTPREEFESQFGSITDDQWQWLKEFFVRQARPLVEDIIGVIHVPTGDFWPVHETSFIMKEGENFRGSRAQTTPAEGG